MIDRLGSQPERLRAVDYPATSEPIRIQVAPRPIAVKRQVGIDVFVEHRGTADELGHQLEDQAGDLQLIMVSNRGQKVYPGGDPSTITTDHWRCRFQARDAGEPVTTGQIIALLDRLAAAGLPFIKTEGLFTFDGTPGYSLSQGQ